MPVVNSCHSQSLLTFRFIHQDLLFSCLHLPNCCYPHQWTKVSGFQHRYKTVSCKFMVFACYRGDS